MADILSFEEFGDQLRIEGVNFKGFGILPKFVMLDTDLTIEAKTIYAYFCSFAGNGNTTFPGRDKILSDLPMSKDTYYKHFRQLTEQGYISTEREQAAGLKGKNIYTLVSNPKKFEEKPDDKKFNQAYSRIRFSGLKSAGFGIIPKAVMIDPRLPVKAKGVYAYFCSFTGSGNNAFPKKEKILFHLGITERTYYKFYKLLTDLNYITAVQRHIDGRLQINDYYLIDTPDEAKAAKKAIFSYSAQDGKNQDIVGGEVKLQDRKIQDIIKQDGKIQDIIKQDAIINKAIKNNSSNNNQSINQQAAQPDTIDRGIELLSNEEVKELVIDEMWEKREFPYSYMFDDRRLSAAIKYMTEYDTFSKPESWGDKDFDHQCYMLFINALIDMLTASDKPMILKGSSISYAKVYNRFCEYVRFEEGNSFTGDFIHIGSLQETALSDFSKACAEKELKNHLQYMKSCIWNAMQTGKIGVLADIRRNFGY